MKGVGLPPTRSLQCKGHIRGPKGHFGCYHCSDVEAEAEAGSGSAGSGYVLWKLKRKQKW